MPTSFDYSVSRSDVATVVKLAGDVTFSHESQARAMINEVDRAEPAVIVFDLGGVTMLDSAGLGMLIMAKTLADRRSATVRITGTNETVRKVMTLARLDQVFELID